MTTKKAKGQRRSWFAEVDGERYPCVHSYWLAGTRHLDPGYLPGEGQWDELVDAITEKKQVIVTKDDPKDAPQKKSGKAFDRTGYIAIFRVDNIKADGEGLKFDLAERLQDLK